MRKRNHHTPTLRLLTRDQLDGRTRSAKLFDELTSGIAGDLGGRSELSVIELSLIDAYAGAHVLMADLCARILSGEQVDLGAVSQRTNAMVKVAARLGIRRRPREVTPPTLAEYLQNKQGSDRGSEWDADPDEEDDVDPDADHS